MPDAVNTDAVSVSVSVSVSASASASVSVSDPASVSASFPTGWYDASDGSVVHLASRTDYALVWGRDVEPKTLEADGFALDAASGAWRARQIAPFRCESLEGARGIDEDVELAPTEGGLLRLEARIAAPLPECVTGMPFPPTLHTSRVLHSIRDAERVRALEALVGEASSPRACERLARCCRSLRGRDLRRTGGMCFQPTSSSIECHDRRLEIVTALRLETGTCVDW
ncbi:MAG TPA: hypothetical protein VLM85_26865 [Polyangiaceae bacterium]|nr:hypothetical protein [Polyangiaceae bacterium]